MSRLRKPQTSNPAAIRSGTADNYSTADKIERVLSWNRQDFETGAYRKLLYRFLSDNIPLIHSCIWTWVRLSAAPGRYRIIDARNDPARTAAESRLEELSRTIYANPLGNRTGLDALLPELFTSLFRDGIFGGFLTVSPDASGVDRFIPIDPVQLRSNNGNKGQRLSLQQEDRRIGLERPDFFYVPFNASASQPFGGSVLQAVPFVAYIEQQMVEDMKRASHNSGYHRLHIKITPPERIGGESDNAYTDRVNEYFDATVRMVKSLEIDENPVTWDNVEISHTGPEKSRDVAASWFMTHRAMIEDICAGTHLAPYLLGYSYGATTTWSQFKFDVVMRQVRSVQTEVGNLLEMMGNVDLALAGLDCRCKYVFDNTFAYQARDNVEIETGLVDNVLKLYEAGLIDRETAQEKVSAIL